MALAAQGCFSIVTGGDRLPESLLWISGWPFLSLAAECFGYSALTCPTIVVTSATVVENGAVGAALDGRRGSCLE